MAKKVYTDVNEYRKDLRSVLSNMKEGGKPIFNKRTLETTLRRETDETLSQVMKDTSPEDWADFITQ